MNRISILFLVLFFYTNTSAALAEICGGIGGLTCSDGAFCDYEATGTCGEGDQEGMCRTIPEICTREFNPVCGCDGTIYSNACVANAAGVSVAPADLCMDASGVPTYSVGVCPQVIVCGLKDGGYKEYPNPCAAEEDGATDIAPKQGATCPALK